MVGHQQVLKWLLECKNMVGKFQNNSEKVEELTTNAIGIFWFNIPRFSPMAKHHLNVSSKCDNSMSRLLESLISF